MKAKYLIVSTLTKTMYIIPLLMMVVILSGLSQEFSEQQNEENLFKVQSSRFKVQGQQAFRNAENPLVYQDDLEGWKSLFDGKTLTGWEIIRYSGGGEPYVRNGAIVLPKATVGLMTGVRWVGEALPTNNYVVHYEARRTAGGDIFAALTFPYDDTYASLIFGGWGGIVNGLSSIDGYDASENETTQLFSQKDNQWYPVELRVTTDSIRARIGSERIVDIATEGRYLHLRNDLVDASFSFWTYLSTGEIRNVRIKEITSN